MVADRCFPGLLDCTFEKISSESHVPKLFTGVEVFLLTMIWWFFLQTFSLNFQNVRICLTFDFYEGKRFFLSVTSEFERIDGLTLLMGTVWVKALFFLYFRLLFSFRISNQDFIRLKSDSIILITWFNTFLRIFGWYFECFRVGVFKSLENWKILHLGAVKSYNMKWIEDKDNIPRLL